MKLKKVLVVEDEEQKRRRIIQAFEKVGIRNYCLVGDATTAIKMLETAEFDLLITDMVFPYEEGKPVVRGEKTGLKMMLELATEGIFIPTIVYSFSMLSKKNREDLAKENYPLLFEPTMDAKMVEQMLAKLLLESTKGSG